MLAEPFSGRSETIRKRGLASPPAAICVADRGRQSRAGRGRSGDADPGGVSADGDRRGPVRPSDDVRLVRARIDPVDEAAELVRRPDAPAPAATELTPRSSGILRGSFRPGSIRHTRAPNGSAAQTSLAPTAIELRPSDRTWILCVIVFVRGSIFATLLSSASIAQTPPPPAAMATALRPFTRPPTRWLVRGSIW